MDGSRVTSYLTCGARTGLGTFERLSDFYTGIYKNDKSEGIGIYQLNKKVPIMSDDQVESKFIDARYNSFTQRYIGEWHDGCFDGWGI